MKKLTSFLLSLILLFSLFACGYKSNYSATMLIRSNSGEECFARWETLNGTLVLNTKKKSTGEGDIHYTASLEEGELTVFYVLRTVKDSPKIELFSIKGGESIDARGGYIESGNKLYIIIETNGKTNGGDIKIDFS